MTTRIFFALLVFMAIFVLVAVIGLGEDERMTTFEKAHQGRSIENGAALFQGNCDRCHGVQGQGIAGVAPALNDPNFFTRRLEEVGYSGSLRSFIASTIDAGRPVKTADWPEAMPTWGQSYGGPLREDQIQDLTNFILNWEMAAKAVAPVPTLVPVGDDPVERGKAVFGGKGGCSGCHTVEGMSGAVGQVGPGLTHIVTVAAGRVDGQTAQEYISESILNPGAFLADECPMGACTDSMPKDLGTRLTSEEIEDLIAFLMTLE